MRSLLSLSLVAIALVIAGCGSDDSGSSAGSSSSAGASTATTQAAACDKAQLDLQRAGTLTVGTDKPAFPPYFEDDDPTNGRGFESAVAYAVARELGFSRDQVRWTTVPFNSSYAPGAKRFDFDINQISITPQRARRVDFSQPYFSAPQAVIAPKGSPVESATSLAELQKAKVGVQVGTTSLDAVNASIRPSAQPQVFNDSNDTVRALKNGRVDAIVTDLPSAFFITAAQVPGSKIVGQFAAPGGDRWGLLLQKGSSLTPCVNQAVAQLRSSGELQRLQDRWMGGDAAPELR
ncbi:MAG: polar amino acid transport system substrate-binding protein [Solirubrobacteraceae bacterium]